MGNVPLEPGDASRRRVRTGGLRDCAARPVELRVTVDESTWIGGWSPPRVCPGRLADRQIRGAQPPPSARSNLRQLAIHSDCCQSLWNL
jgi:hypothetical protein